jgi:curved DNA-binding protein
VEDMMVFKDYYKILGLDSNKVTEDEIKTAYREKAKKYHPDMNVGNVDYEEVFKDINEAYRILGNDRTKRKYDFQWKRYASKESKPTTKDEKKSLKDNLIGIFLGEEGKTVKERSKLAHKYGEDIITRIDVSIEEAFFGVNKKLQLKNIDGKDTSTDIRIPAGIQNGEQIRLVGHGKPGKNGGKNGDLVVVIRIKDSRNLHLERTNLATMLPLKVWEAALGTTKTIEILNERISIIIPEKTNSNQNIIIKGKGYKAGEGKRGDLRVITQIVFDNKMDEKNKKLYMELKNNDTKG